MKIINKNYDINKVQRKIGGEIVKRGTIFFFFFSFSPCSLKTFSSRPVILGPFSERDDEAPAQGAFGS